MSGWAPPDSDLLDPSAPGPGASWSPPDSDLIAGAPDNSSGTRVENPGTEAFAAGASVYRIPAKSAAVSAAAITANVNRRN